ncbi:MAG TPA: hypothetical protein VKZ79_06655 [Alphaproteobacteria bacterium]|nr:hypothetical protein [Alphaproteobacteria bacterium]
MKGNLAAVIVFLIAVPLARAQQVGNYTTWYYCDPAKAYYPNVTSCPVPWRRVQTTQPQAITVPKASGAQDAPADYTWRPHPREAYGPDTYYNWNRTGLPPAQQKICIEYYDKKHPPHVFKWMKVEADNGAVYKIDLNSVEKMQGGSVTALIYIDEGSGYNPENMRGFIFDCEGHYADTSTASMTMYAPPRSVAGRLSSIACANR